MLAALDVDSLCACKILQALFKADNVEHTLIPVAGKSDLHKAYTDHSDQVKFYVCLLRKLTQCMCVLLYELSY